MPPRLPASIHRRHRSGPRPRISSPLSAQTGPFFFFSYLPQTKRCAERHTRVPSSHPQHSASTSASLLCPPHTSTSNLPRHLSALARANGSPATCIDLRPPLSETRWNTPLPFRRCGNGATPGPCRSICDTSGHGGSE